MAPSAAVLLVASLPLAAQFTVSLEPRTSAAFERYFQGVDAAMLSRAASPQTLSNLPPGVTSHAAGVAAGGNGMIHDWSAISFLPGRKKAEAIRILEGFEKHPSIFKEVIEGRIVEKRDGGAIQAFHRIRKKSTIEVTLELNYDIRPVPTPPNRYATRSIATRIVEVEGNERLPPGNDHGFLWRLNTFWILEETPQGLWMECRSVSLTRSAPLGLGWIVNPIVRDLPRQALQDLMDSTREAIQAGR